MCIGGLGAGDRGGEEIGSGQVNGVGRNVWLAIGSSLSFVNTDGDWWSTTTVTLLST